MLNEQKRGKGSTRSSGKATCRGGKIVGKKQWQFEISGKKRGRVKESSEDRGAHNGEDGRKTGA